MSAGIGSIEFQQIAKVSFVRAAERVARLGNSRVNRSAVAAMTGLSRSEVRRLSTGGPRGRIGNARQRALRVMDGWQTDLAFLAASGAPKALSLRSKNAGFSALVHRYSGDIPPKPILKELLRLGLVHVTGQAVSVRKTSPDKHAMHQLQVLVSTLIPVLNELGANPADRKTLIGRGLSITVHDAKAKKILRKQLGEATQSFLTNIRNAAEGASLPRKAHKPQDLATHICVLISD